jgi:hypothetical protein
LETPVIVRLYPKSYLNFSVVPEGNNKMSETRIYDGENAGDLPLILPDGTETRSQVINGALWDIWEVVNTAPADDIAAVTAFIEQRLQIWESQRPSSRPPESSEQSVPESVAVGRP